VAKPWLDLGYNVAVVGYRTYPDARIHGQVVDLQEAMHFLLNKHYHDAHNDMTVHLVGHSSGAHVALTHMVQHAKQLLMAMSHQHSWSSGFRRPYDSFIGISGPYNVSHHFDYEAARGVEELSPLKAVNGLSREALIQNSPGTQLQQLLLEYDGMLQQHFPPRILLAHGVEDTTVPFTATAELAHVLRDCGITGVDQLYLARTGHQDAVLQLMLGGLTLDRIITWVETVAKAQTKAEVFGRQQVVIQSRL
jgi:acetyl esterase/lipase